MTRFVAAAIVVIAVTSAVAQSYVFEAASVKAASPDNPPGQSLSGAPGRFTAVNVPVRFLIDELVVERVQRPSPD